MRTETPTPTGAPTRVAIKTDVKPEFAAEIRRAAQEDGRTVSGYIRRVLVKHLEPGSERGQDSE
jgi:hypothetical protein